MKLSLAIFAAVLCASAVTGAPSTVEDTFNIEEYAGDWWINFKCAGEILNQDASPKVKALWAEYKAKLKKLHDTDWEKCKKIDNIADQQKCMAAVMEKSIGIYSEFFTKLIKIVDWDKVKEIRKKVHDKCMKQDKFFDLFELDDDIEEQSISDMSFDLFAVSDSFDFEDKLHRDYWINLKCARQVIAEEASPEVKALWAEYKAKLEKLRDTDWAKCKKIDNIADQQKCKVAVMEKSIGIYSEFFTKLIKVAKWDKVREIRKKIGEKCVKHDSDDEDDIEASAGTPLPDQFQCIVDVLDSVSKKNGLEKEWQKYQPDMQRHLDQWKQCANVENKFVKLLCNIKEGATVFRLFNDYVRMIAAEKPTLVMQIAREIREKCNSQIIDGDSLELDTNMLTGGFLDKIKCISEQISDALKKTDYSKSWEKLKKDLEKAGDRFKACKGDNFTEWAKCIAKETQHVKDVIQSFLNDLKLKNKDLYDRVKKNIDKNCK